MFGACSVLLRMNKSAQVGGAQIQHDKIGGRNDVDDILFAYGVVTRRLPSSCIHTEHGVYYRGIDTIQTTPYRLQHLDRPKGKSRYTTTRREGGEYYVRLHHDWPGWRIEFEWLLSLGLVWFHFPRAPISEQSRKGESGWMGEVTRGVGGRKKWEKKKKKREKVKENILLNSRKRLKLSWCDKTSGPCESKRLLLACSGG